MKVIISMLILITLSSLSYGDCYIIGADGEEKINLGYADIIINAQKYMQENYGINSAQLEVEECGYLYTGVEDPQFLRFSPYESNEKFNRYRIIWCRDYEENAPNCHVNELRSFNYNERVIDTDLVSEYEPLIEVAQCIINLQKRGHLIGMRYSLLRQKSELTSIGEFELISSIHKLDNINEYQVDFSINSFSVTISSNQECLVAEVTRIMI